MHACDLRAYCVCRLCSAARSVGRTCHAWSRSGVQGGPRRARGVSWCASGLWVRTPASITHVPVGEHGHSNSCPLRGLISRRAPFGPHLPDTLLPLPLPLPFLYAHTETRIFRTPPPGEPRGQPCVIEPVDLGPIHPPTACNPPPPLPTFSSFPASSSLPPVPPPMAHAPLVAAPLPSMPPPPVFAGPSMPRASITRPPMACPPVAPPPPMLPRPQLMVPFPPPPNTHTHPSHTYSQSYTHPYAFHPAPDVQSWAPPLDLLPVPQLLPPQAVPPRVDMPSDELQTLWEVRGHMWSWRFLYM